MRRIALTGRCDLGFTFSVNADGSGQQTTTIRQQFQSAAVQHGDNGPASFSVVSNTVTPSDTLLFDANFNITGSTGQQSAQDFFSNDSVNGCFSRQITASAGLADFNNRRRSLQKGQQLNQARARASARAPYFHSRRFLRSRNEPRMISANK